jgi:hypothetical protein
MAVITKKQPFFPYFSVELGWNSRRNDTLFASAAGSRSTVTACWLRAKRLSGSATGGV